eukprot:426169_1
MSSKKRDHKQLKQMSTPTKSPPRKKQNTTSPIQMCNELINTFDNEKPKRSKLTGAWGQIMGKQHQNKNKNNKNAPKKKEPNKKSTKKVRKISTKNKDAIYMIFAKVHNKIIPALAAQSRNDENNFKPIQITDTDDEKKDGSTNILKL